MAYKQIDGKWPEPTKQDFPLMSRRTTWKGFWFEDMHWWWRHLPKDQQYIPPNSLIMSQQFTSFEEIKAEVIAAGYIISGNGNDYAAHKGNDLVRQTYGSFSSEYNAYIWIHDHYIKNSNWYLTH